MIRLPVKTKNSNYLFKGGIHHAISCHCSNPEDNSGCRLCYCRICLWSAVTLCYVWSAILNTVSLHPTVVDYCTVRYGTGGVVQASVCTVLNRRIFFLLVKNAYWGLFSRFFMEISTFLISMKNPLKGPNKCFSRIKKYPPDFTESAGRK